MASQGRARANEQLIMSLACGATVEKAAEQSGISEATVYRRLKEVEFRDQLNQFRAEMVLRAAGMLTAAAMESVKTLLELQKSDSPPAVKLGAAKAVLELRIKLRESGDLAERVAALEKQIHQAITEVA